MLLYEKVFENNRRWLKDKKAADKDFFQKLAYEQNPDFMIIGCSDSRVPLESITGAQPGDLFVHRNVANQASKSDHSVLSAIEFAISNFNIKHIVVCGHTQCGGVSTAMESEDEDTNLGSWLSNIRYVMKKHDDELHILDPDKKYNRLIELNTLEQCRNIASLKIIQSSQGKTGFPIVHAWIYDIETGQLYDLNY